MRRKLSLLIAFVGVLGLLGLAPAAQANHAGDPGDDNKAEGKHERMPTPPVAQLGGECVVDGVVQIGDENNEGGVSASEKNHNHYFFQQTTINCVNTPEVGNDMSGFDGDHAVDAAGGTDGPWSNPVQEVGQHGEDDALGWSHGDTYAGTVANDAFGSQDAGASEKKTSFGDLYDGVNTNDGAQCTNCGEIVVDGFGGTDAENNVVMFLRETANVTAWGAIEDVQGQLNKGSFVCFVAELEFVPTNTVDSDGDGVPDKSVEANLTGAAEIWAGDAKSDCGVSNHGGKKS